MTNIKDGKPFHLYPPEHPDDIAAATAANLQAMREYKERKLATVTEPHTTPKGMHARQMIHEHHARMEREMMAGVERQKQIHREFAAQNPEVKDFRWSKSDPPGTPRHDPEHYVNMMKMLDSYYRKQYLKRGARNNDKR
jgi:hypothetical protein